MYASIDVCVCVVVCVFRPRAEFSLSVGTQARVPRGFPTPLPLGPILLRPTSTHGCQATTPPGVGLTTPSAFSFLLQAKLGDEILDYRDLAALPKSKAIYSIDRPDMISYSPFISHSVGDRQSCSEVRPCPARGQPAGRGTHSRSPWRPSPRPSGGLSLLYPLR